MTTPYEEAVYNGRATAQGLVTEAPPKDNSLAEVWLASYDAEMSRQPPEAQEAEKRKLHQALLSGYYAFAAGMAYFMKLRKKSATS